MNRVHNFSLTNRKIKAVVEGEQLEDVTVNSGVPKGTVHGLLLILSCIHDLPDADKSSARLQMTAYSIDKHKTMMKFCK